MPVSYTATTVLVTGASSGLGEEFARQLAARGANLVLVARRIDRLEQLATELSTKHGISVTPIKSDLSEPNAASSLGAELIRRDIRVTSLINNAGFATRNEFQNEEAARIDQEIAVNVSALVALTRQFYPELRKNGAGVLINVASTAAYQPVPLLAVYGATKAFVLSFTEALWSEAAGSGLKVLALSPGSTRTEFFDFAGAGARVGKFRTAQDVVALALATLDKRNPPPSVIDGRSNRAAVFASRFVSRRGLIRLTERVTGRTVG
jgi:hypothetical protein